MAKHRDNDLPAGIREMSPPPPEPTPVADFGHSPTGFWRLQVYLPTSREPGAPDHVVRATDRANAEMAFRQELGIRSIDLTVNQMDVTPATESDFIRAQAKRLGADLREHRRIPPDAKKDHLGIVKGFYPLTWEVPGGAKGQYEVNEVGELREVKEEKKAA